MRLAAFGDVHGNLPALEAVLADIGRRAADAMVCLGDLAFKGPAPSECVALLRERGIPCVQGNTDLYLVDEARGRSRPVPEGYNFSPGIRLYLEWHLERLAPADIDYLEGLPAGLEFGVGNKNVLAVHGTPGNLWGNIVPGQPLDAVAAAVAGANAAIIVMGHTHRVLLLRAADRLLINAGGVGQSQDGDWRASYVIIDTGGPSVEFRRVTYDLDRTVAQARERRFCISPGWYGETLRKGYWEFIPWEERLKIDGLR